MRGWLKDARIKLDMTQEEVAQSAGIERAYYTMIENGTRTPSVYVAKKISSILKTQWTIFFANNSHETTLNNEHAC